MTERIRRSVAALAACSAAMLVLSAAPAPAFAQDPPAKGGPDLGGKLYRSVFTAGTGLLASSDVETLAEPLRSRLMRYLARRAAFKSQYKHDAEDLKTVRADAKRRALERSIVSLIEADGVERMAADFVAAAPIAPEWSGLPEPPLAEAAFAEDTLKASPSSPLAPWLYVFIAQRQRVVFEAYENQQNQEAMRTAARKYRAFVERARGVSDPVVVALIDDMERERYLYIRGANHPRDYNPDT